jgi:mannose-6-phosphate isomerase-like protein (cupin superfamily)
MIHVRKIGLTAFAAIAFGAGWLAKTTAQQIPSVPLMTYFSHEKVDASFTEAAAAGGGRVLFSRKDSQGRTFTVNTNSRGQAENGELHSHEGWTAVVVVMSGAATFVTPGTSVAAKAAKTSAPDALGGQSIGSGESHRISKGDVIIIPPGVPHSYQNVEEPFRYLVVQTPL